MTKIYSEEYTEKRSRFIAFLYAVEDEKDFKDAFEGLSEEHAKARHILRSAYYRNHFGVPTLTSSEDKEPISSMKRLSSLMEMKKTVGYAVFIVRYFGGTKLGASHLDRIYFGLGAKVLQHIPNGLPF